MESIENLPKESINELDEPQIEKMKSFDLHFAGMHLLVKLPENKSNSEAIIKNVQDRIHSVELKLKDRSSWLPSHMIALQGLFELAEEYENAKERFLEYQNELKKEWMSQSSFGNA